MNGCVQNLSVDKNYTLRDIRVLSQKKLSYWYRYPHVKDETVSRPSYHLHGNTHTWERRYLYWNRAQVSIYFRTVADVLPSS